MKAHPRISPRLLPESECKGTTFLNSDQIFQQLFSRKSEKRGKRGGKHGAFTLREHRAHHISRTRRTISRPYSASLFALSARVGWYMHNEFFNIRVLPHEYDLSDKKKNPHGDFTV
jgi:hypothetical protein